MTIEERVDEARVLGIRVIKSIPAYAPIYMGLERLKAEVYFWLESKVELYDLKQKFKKFMEG